jgi:hypothetical protein
VLDAQRVGGSGGGVRTPPGLVEPIGWTNKVNAYTARALNMTPFQLGKAIHDLKDALHFGGADNIGINTDNGDVEFNGEPVGNLYDER